ncbi:hypothetical protein [Kibdelosporangium philippinense]|uniref:hypothetical protein n=1 Tax=Kibdelosporangium philippinense TaxID=211113 RepID=UPI003615BBC0
MLAVSKHTDGMPQTSGMTQVTAREEAHVRACEDTIDTVLSSCDGRGQAGRLT